MRLLLLLITPPENPPCKSLRMRNGEKIKNEKEEMGPSADADADADVGEEGVVEEDKDDAEEWTATNHPAIIFRA